MTTHFRGGWRPARGLSVSSRVRVAIVLSLLLVRLSSIAGQSLDDRLAEPAFAKFHNGIRACLKSTRSDCLTQYLDQAFAFHPWWQPGGAPVSRAEFARFARQTMPPGAKEPLWKALERVLTSGRLRILDGGMLFSDDTIECRAYELRDAYLMTSCYAP